MRELAKEFALSPNALKEELDSLSHAGYLEREQNGRSAYFRANTKHPFFPEISSIVRKTIGIDQLLDEVIASLGKLDAVYILDDYALGKDTGLIDLLVVGEVDRLRLDELARITESKISRKVRPFALTKKEFMTTKAVFLRRPHWRVI